MPRSRAESHKLTISTVVLNVKVTDKVTRWYITWKYVMEPV